jgi:hypothetical protein
MFSLFKKSDSFVISDKIWMTEQEGLKGLATNAMKAITEGSTPVIVSFFDDAQDKLSTFLMREGVPFKDADENFPNEADKNILLVSAGHAGQLIRNLFLKKHRLTFLFTGHHPLISTESKLLNEIYSLTQIKSFLFCLSLDNPLMQFFGSENMKSLMEKLGMKKDECVEHGMVSKSIMRAREKISERVKTEIHSTSEKEWFDRNVNSNNRA